MTTKTENTGNNYFTEHGILSRQQLRDLNTSMQEGDIRSRSRTPVVGEAVDRLAERIEYLSGFVLPGRYESLTRRLDYRTRYMVMCLEDIYYPHNASAVIRSSEAFGLQEMHAVEKTVRFAPNKQIVRGTDQWLDIRKWADTPSLVAHLRGRGYRIAVTAPPKPGETDRNFTPSTFDVSAGPFALFMGTEKSGISPELMAAADAVISIPMVGFAESLNISVSAAIVAQRLTERLRAEGSGVSWALATDDREQLLYRWLCHSVRDFAGILERGGFGG